MTATPAWNGWSRPGRATEIDVLLNTDAATTATVDLVAGRHTLHAKVELQPGRSLRLQLPVSSGAGVTVSVAVPNGARERRDIDISQSESPLLGAALASGDAVQLEGFHTVVLTADDLPRNASAYSSVDALVLDEPTLRALDQRQLGALLAHVTACGRVVLLNTAARIGQLLEGAGGCGALSLSSAASLAQAREMLRTSLSGRLPEPMARDDLIGLARPTHPVLTRVTVAFALYLAATVLVLMFTTHLAVLLLMPALSALVALTLLHAMPPPAQLVIWSEGVSGVPLARYQAWQQFAGVLRGHMRVPIPLQLAAAATPCDPTTAMRFEFDASRAQVAFAEFETRLFRQVALCYTGSFPVSRAISIETRDDGVHIVRNSGVKTWPQGTLVLGGLVHDLPALGPGAKAALAANAGHDQRDAIRRTAMMRTQANDAAAMWTLELDGVSGIPADSRGWLLVAVPMP
jgi:hypothetical protein